MENNQYNNTENNTNDTLNTSNTESAGSTGQTANAQQESSSTYSYSYLNQEQKNPNNIWRADENTAGTYTTGSNTYTNTQTGANGSNTQAGSGYSSNTQAGSGYGSSAQTGSGYSSTQSGINNVYGSTDNVYGSSQANTGSAYSNTQTGTAQQSWDSNAQGTNSAYSGTQTGTDNHYSNIYGTASGQSGWNTYSDAKQQKKEARAQKRAAKKANAAAGTGTSANFGIKLAKCASIALVFGLVAGTALEGSRYAMSNLLGTNEKEPAVVSDTGTGQEVLKIEDGTKSTTPLSAASNTGDGVVAIVEECMPSIVAITNMSLVQYQNFFGQVQRYEMPSAGSGIIVSEDQDYLYIATNNHVIESATTLTVRFNDDATAEAEVKGTDESTDLAVIRVKKSDMDEKTLSAIKVATLGDSEKIKVGSQAIAIGNALGYGQSVTAGYISALEREVTTQDETTGRSYTNYLIQTDAAINPGNSGGALLNSSGEVIGINSSKYNDTAVEGMGFAIPANTAKPIIEDLITKEIVSDDKAAYLGIYMEDVTATISEAYHMPEGVFVREVLKGTPAEKYGLEAGDIITSIDGRKVSTREELAKRLRYYEAGAQAELTIQRQTQDGYQEQKITVVLAKKES